MGSFWTILEGLALNPEIDDSIGSLITGIATNLLTNSGEPEIIKQLGLDLIANSGKIVDAVLQSTIAAPAPPAQTPAQTPAQPTPIAPVATSPRAG